MNRNNALDIAKCWAICSVVLYHVESRIFVDAGLHAFIDTYFLSLFFLISGLLTKAEKVIETKWVKKQFTHVIVPFLTSFSLYHLFLSCFEPVNILHRLGDAKGGFWFLLTLFMFMVSLHIYCRLTQSIKNKYLKAALLFIPMIVVTALTILLPTEYSEYLSLPSYRRYWLFYAYGYAITNIFHQQDQIYNHKIGIPSIICYIVLGALYIFHIQSVSSILDLGCWMLVNFAACHTWLYLAKLLEQKISTSWVLNAGRQTLGIYIIHYYPLYITVMLLKDYGGIATPYKYLLGILLSLLIVIITKYIVTLIDRNKYTSLLILGNNTK